MMRLLIEIALRELQRGNREAFRLVLRDLRRPRPQAVVDIDTHLRAAIAWLCRAQDVTGAGGVARSYCIAWHPYFRIVGWLPAYPETTGYIIPTMFDYAAATNDAEIRQRAIRMAEWEIEVQMPCGAVQGGVIGMTPTPAVFNTGQVIFGWLRAARETADDRFLHAAARAGRFLVENQDADGVWRKGVSAYARSPWRTYNTRTAWALVELAAATGDSVYREAAVRNVDSAVTRQLANGWFPGNCLDNDDAPLTHTIAYATRGVLEAGIRLSNECYITAARRAADAVLAQQRADGSLAGRYDCNWRPMVSWSCLTGNVQIALVWLHLARLLNDDRYHQAARRSIAFVAACQDLHSDNDGVRGGIAGAYPIFGDYGRFELLNWAAKFFAEAIMTEQELTTLTRAARAQALNHPESATA